MPLSKPFWPTHNVAVQPVDSAPMFVWHDNREKNKLHVRVPNFGRLNFECRSSKWMKVYFYNADRVRKSTYINCEIGSFYDRELTFIINTESIEFPMVDDVKLKMVRRYADRDVTDVKPLALCRRVRAPYLMRIRLFAALIARVKAFKSCLYTARPVALPELVQFIDASRAVNFELVFNEAITKEE